MADIRHSLQIAASVEAIVPLISIAHGPAQWWAEDVTEVEGCAELGFFNRSTVYRLQPQAGDPPRRIEWRCETGQEWSGTRLVFQLESAGNGTLLRFRHAGWASDSDYFVSCTTVWGELMFRLKAAAEGRPRGPLFLSGGLAY